MEILYEYFCQNPMYRKENWIDFESEISNVIKSLHKDMKSNDETLEDTVVQCSNCFLNSKFCSYLDETKPVMSTYIILILILFMEKQISTIQ